MDQENKLWKRITKLNLWRRKGQIREQNEKAMEAKKAEYDAKLAQLNTAIDKVRYALSHCLCRSLLALKRSFERSKGRTVTIVYVKTSVRSDVDGNELSGFCCERVRMD